MYILSCRVRFHTDGFSGPSCRSAISADKIFVREAFEPQDDDLAEASASRCKTEVYSNTELAPHNMRRDLKGKGKAKKRLRQGYSVDDSDEDYDDDLSDFVVEDGEVEEKDARCELKPLKRKRMIVESDDDMEFDEYAAIIGHKEPDLVTDEVKTMSRFLPSTKMKVWIVLYNPKMPCLTIATRRK